MKPFGFTLIPAGSVDEEFMPKDDTPNSGFLFLACYELAGQKDLATYLYKHPTKKRSERFMANVFDSILAGLEYLHGQQALHGDIKPENVRPLELQLIRPLCI